MPVPATRPSAITALDPMDERALRRAVQRAGHGVERDLALALARELRLAEVLGGRPLLVEELPLPAALAAAAAAGLTDPAEGVGGRLRAWDVARTLVGQRIDAAARRVHRGPLGKVERLSLSAAGRSLSILAVPVHGYEGRLSLRPVDRDRRGLGPCELAGLRVDDAVPAAGGLADEAEGLWMRLVDPVGIARAVTVRAEPVGSAPADVRPKLIFQLDVLDAAGEGSTAVAA